MVLMPSFSSQERTSLTLSAVKPYWVLKTAPPKMILTLFVVGAILYSILRWDVVVKWSGGLLGFSVKMC